MMAALLALTLAATMPARGADAGQDITAPPPNTVRIGLYALFYHVRAHDISGPYVPAGVNLDVNNVQTLYLAYVRRLWSHLDAELAFGWPPLTRTVGRGPAVLGSVPYNGQVISTARWFAPTLLFNYVFFDDTHALRPYVGIGVNYTRFYDRDSTAAGNAASGGPTRLSLRASVGPAADVGVSYRWASRWSAYLSYSFSAVNSDLTADTAGVIRRSRIHFRPTALVASIGYSF
jgi:outer membrane protein